MIDAINEAPRREVLRAVAELLEDGYVPEGWQETRYASGDYDLSDAAVLPGVITELRKRGYTVEPGGQNV